MLVHGVGQQADLVARSTAMRTVRSPSAMRTAASRARQRTGDGALHDGMQDRREDRQRHQAAEDGAVAQARRFLDDLVLVGAAGDQPVPVLEQGVGDDLRARVSAAPGFCHG
jgi:hypothetical protein